LDEHATFNDDCIEIGSHRGSEIVEIEIFLRLEDDAPYEYLIDIHTHLGGEARVLPSIVAKNHLILFVIILPVFLCLSLRLVSLGPSIICGG
jgi:hypothetical protein